MRPRLERAILVGIALAAVGWLFRGELRAAKWALQGTWELIGLPAAQPAAAIAPPARVAHAGGALRGVRYTNAVEALEQNYLAGARWFEMDFLADGRDRFWAVHDWGEAHERLSIPLDGHGRGIPEEQPSGAPFRPATLEQVLEWFAAHRDARLITDTKGDNVALLRRLAVEPPERRARIHPQIYRIGEYAQARAGRFGAPIFTTYRSAYPWWVLRRFARHSSLLALTVTREEASPACAALCGRVPLLTHTVNDPADAAILMRAGLAGIYTDDLLP